MGAFQANVERGRVRSSPTRAGRLRRVVTNEHTPVSPAPPYACAWCAIPSTTKPLHRAAARGTDAPARVPGSVHHAVRR